MKIDAHNHALPDPVIELLQAESAYGVTVKDGVVSSGALSDHELFRSQHDPAAKLAELESRGLEGAIMSLEPRMLAYNLELAHGEAMAEACNRGLREMAAHDPQRLYWLAQVPLQDPARAGEVLKAAVADGAVGAAIGSWTGTHRLDEDAYGVWWQAVEDAGVPVFIHNAYNTPISGLKAFYLGNVIGNLLETTICAERLVASGMLERHPGVRIVLAHAGGYFPFQAGRLRHAKTVRQELADAPADPWSFAGQLIFDTITHDVQALTYLVSRVGVENVVMGTDLPYDMSTPAPWDSLVEAVGEATATQIAEDNVARLFNL
ncbi:amidohydrolase [Solirubrobacter ginsenosidimutans]|uniref:Amidohydrolase n=1 Tax=Solirubrobacter ginsenosidimutans TaxID=490573 RepID=A0A9X3MMB8_9ACTN|nr:amidohydrolase family protein [Solirubrobacter ginsenosidimutans]MDA0159231.1 amidohydrolase [Solirubrobacter ginsenosidimutans]